MIRLSTAHAKCRLSKIIDIEDAQAAVELVQFAYFKKVWYFVCCTVTYVPWQYNYTLHA